MSSDVLAVYRCGCRIVRDDGGCGVHIQWCRLHENAGGLLRVCIETYRQIEDSKQAGLWMDNSELQAIIIKAKGV